MKHDLNITSKSYRRKHKKKPCDMESKMLLDLESKEIN